MFCYCFTKGSTTAHCMHTHITLHAYTHHTAIIFQKKWNHRIWQYIFVISKNKQMTEGVDCTHTHTAFCKHTHNELHSFFLHYLHWYNSQPSIATNHTIFSDELRRRGVLHLKRNGLLHGFSQCTAKNIQWASKHIQRSCNHRGKQ